MLYPRRLKKQ
jgi:hypothetical protein